MKTLNLLLLFALLGFPIHHSESQVILKNKNRITTGLSIGDTAPNLEFENPDGKKLNLYDLRGKIVLIDFWASWCRPCRMENPNIVEAYQKYSKAKMKDAKGFTVFSVSLDKNRNAWKRAISSDHLDWPYHISDLKAWHSKAAEIYHVRSIPTNVLIDAKGKIIAKNLRGPQLHYELDKLVLKFKKKSN
ncbi:MAG: TlpA family protein disulfide reductase [Flavobacteriales bacterium]